MIKKLMLMSLVAIVVISLFGTILVSAPGHASENKVTVDCTNVAVALLTLNLAIVNMDNGSTFDDKFRLLGDITRFEI